jgi:hypothetical protein
MRRVLFAFVLCVAFVCFPQQTFASIDSCTGSTDTHSVPPNSNNSMSFTVTNGGPSSANWAKIIVPSGNFTISTGASVPSGWSATINGDSTEMTVVSESTFATDLTFSVQVTSANTTAASANWTMRISDDGGSTTVECGGDSRGIAIEGTPTVADPEISDIVVSDISDTQAKISWTTDVSTTTVVDYGTTGAYGSTITGDSGTTHSVTITGLSANTTYHYNVKSVRAEGNSAESGENTFTTAKQGTTTTITVTGSVTTRTVSATPTPTPKPDTSPPRVSVSTDIDKVFTEAPVIKGTATDPSGVATLEYSLDDGRSYLPVDEITSPGRTSTAFEFTPESLLDDNYILKIRAADLKGNKGETEIGTLIVDRLPPRIGGNVASLGPQVLAPMPDGSYVIPAGIDFKITVSAVGGPTSIDLGYVNDLGIVTKIPLKKNPDNGLWSALFRFDKAGTYALTAYAIDGAKNRAERVISTVIVVPNGQVVSGTSPVTNGKISVYYLDDTMKKFVLWDGSAYGQTNPAPLDTAGNYRLYLPSGTYYFDIQAGGYQSLVSSIFTIPQAYPIVTNFNLTRARAIRIWKWLIPLPDFRVTTATVTVAAPEVGTSTTASALIGREIPYFKFINGAKTLTSLDLRGKPTVVTFLNTWLPTATSQMAILDDVVKKQELNAVVIVPQETVSSVAIFKNRGGYAVPVVADPDGDLVEPLMLSTMPTHIIVNRKGVITNVKSGVFIKDELFDMIIQ